MTVQHNCQDGLRVWMDEEPLNRICLQPPAASCHDTGQGACFRQVLSR